MAVIRTHVATGLQTLRGFCHSIEDLIFDTSPKSVWSMEEMGLALAEKKNGEMVGRTTHNHK